MDAKTIVVSVVSIAIACLFAVTLLIPVIAESTTTEDTFTNVGYYDMTYTSEDDISLSWDRTTPDKITVNDEVITLSPPDTGKPRTLVCGDDWLVRYWKSGSIIGIEYTPATGSGTSANSSGNNNFSLNASGGSLSVTGSSTLTNTYTYLYCVANDGDYVMKDASQEAYLNGDSVIYAMGNTANMPKSGVTVFLKTTGDIKDGLTTTVFRVDGTVDEVTANTPVITYSQVDSYVDLYKIDKFTVDVTDGVDTGTVTYSYFIVPADVTAERSIHPDASTTALLNIIPLFVVMGIILGTVGIIAMRK